MRGDLPGWVIALSSRGGFLTPLTVYLFRFSGCLIRCSLVFSIATQMAARETIISSISHLLFSVVVTPFGLTLTIITCCHVISKLE